MAIELWLVRHGERMDQAPHSRWTFQATSEERADPGLTAQGRWQARKTAERLQCERAGYVYSSPFLRCAETAADIAALSRVRVRVEEGLGECMSRAHYAEQPRTRTPDQLDDLLGVMDTEHVSLTPTPQWPEDEEQTKSRCAATVDALLCRHAAADPAVKTVVVLVTHSFVVKCIAQHLSGGRVSGERGHCCLTRLCRRTPGAPWAMDILYDCRHLSESSLCNSSSSTSFRIHTDIRLLQSPTGGGCAEGHDPFCTPKTGDRRARRRTRVAQLRGGCSGVADVVTAADREVLRLQLRLRRAEARRDALRREAAEHSRKYGRVSLLPLASVAAFLCPSDADRMAKALRTPTPASALTPAPASALSSGRRRRGQGAARRLVTSARVLMAPSSPSSGAIRGEPPSAPAPLRAPLAERAGASDSDALAIDACGTPERAPRAPPRECSPLPSPGQHAIPGPLRPCDMNPGAGLGCNNALCPVPLGLSPARVCSGRPAPPPRQRAAATQRGHCAEHLTRKRRGGGSPRRLSAGSSSGSQVSAVAAIVVADNAEALGAGAPPSPRRDVLRYG
eukprot:TRINITY_DN65486_c0_g1_i1.p1 TRINITY_DN65486_c0_g1~~TRINITY_DN65486_c0_g1_i1.p1  ORF type:complete len:565 (+),score=132.03 TRINITY_DN65486_c0_g1_i1:71-1765(+)